MIVKRNLCICGEKQNPKQTNDKFKTIICENCLEVISYEKPEKKKLKTIYGKGQSFFLIQYRAYFEENDEYVLVKANSFEDAVEKIKKQINVCYYKNVTIE